MLRRLVSTRVASFHCKRVAPTQSAHLSAQCLISVCNRVIIILAIHRYIHWLSIDIIIYIYIASIYLLYIDIYWLTIKVYCFVE